MSGDPITTPEPTTPAPAPAPEPVTPTPAIKQPTKAKTKYQPYRWKR